MTHGHAREQMLAALCRARRQFARVPVLAECAGLSPRLARRALDQLVAVGLAERGMPTTPRRGRCEATYRASAAGFALRAAVRDVRRVRAGEPAPAEPAWLSQLDLFTGGR